MRKIKIGALILDYGGVISKPQAVEHVEKMRSVVKQDYEDFETIYRSHRAGYDSGHRTAAEYWAGVLKHFDIEPAEAKIAALIQEDIKSWTQLNDSFHIH